MFDWLVNDPPAGGEFTNHQSRSCDTVTQGCKPWERRAYFWDDDEVTIGNLCHQLDKNDISTKDVNVRDVYDTA